MFLTKYNLNLNIPVLFCILKALKNQTHFTEWEMGEGWCLMSENISWQVQSGCHSPRWQVLQNCTLQPWSSMIKLENKTVNTFLIELDCQQSTNTEFKDLDDFILILWMKLIPWNLFAKISFLCHCPHKYLFSSTIPSKRNKNS